MVPGVPFTEQGWDSVMKTRVYWSKFLYDKALPKTSCIPVPRCTRPTTKERSWLLCDCHRDTQRKCIRRNQAEHSTENLYYSFHKSRKLGFQTVALRQILSRQSNYAGMPGKGRQVGRSHTDRIRQFTVDAPGDDRPESITSRHIIVISFPCRSGSRSGNDSAEQQRMSTRTLINKWLYFTVKSTLISAQSRLCSVCRHRKVIFSSTDDPGVRLFTVTSASSASLYLKAPHWFHVLLKMMVHPRLSTFQGE